MSDDLIEPRVQYVGPFSEHLVVVDGWQIPLITAAPHGEQDEKIMLIIDKRLAATFSVEEAERFVPFLADAIAVALGYGAHPREDDEAPLAQAPHIRPIRLRGIGAVSVDSVPPPYNPGSEAGEGE